MSHKSKPFLIPGSAGLLEGAIDYPSHPLASTDCVGIICHPHPLYGGTMHNKVATTLSWAFTQRGIPAVRFNYRGVGQSQGQYGHFVGEEEDLMTILRFAKDTFSPKSIWLGGFSFGSFIAANGAIREPLTQQLITVAPAVNHADFYALTGVSCPWTVIQGEQDDVVPPEEVYAFANAFKHKIHLERIAHADHFFHGKILALRETILKSLPTV